MAKKNDSWGIEVGANALKAMRLVRNGSVVELAEYDILPFKQVLTTPDLNVEEAIQVQLDAFLSKHDVSRSQVVASVPGHLAFARFAKLPPVEPKKVAQIVRYEAQQQIPFPIDQVEWDYQVFQQADSPDVEVGIFAITKERMMGFLSNYRRVNLELDAVTLSPLAVHNAFAHENRNSPEEQGVIYLDVGTSCTDVIIVEQGGIWLRTLPIGGNNFTEALVRAFKLSFPKAEKIKREAATSKYSRQIYQAMRPVFADLVQELQRSLGYYQSLNRDANITKLVGVGSTFRLPGLQKFLKQQLQIEVTRPDGFSEIEIEAKREAEFADLALNMCTAYGLALQGLGLERVSANILPERILRQRMWKAKEPWVGAAAAIVVAATAAVGGMHFYIQAQHAGLAQETDRAIAPVLSEARNFANQLRDIETATDPRHRIENLRRTLDYRELWPKLLEDIATAAMTGAPQPETQLANYTDLAAIPRTQRQRLYIQSIRADYLASDPQAQAAASASSRSSSSSSAANPLGGTFTLDDFFGASGQTRVPPRFEVTIAGTTPVAEGARFLERNFIAWLQQNANRADRPYRFTINPSTVLSMTQVTEVLDARRRVPSSAGLEADPFGVEPYSQPGPVVPSRIPQRDSRFGGGAAIVRGVQPTQTPTQGLNELLPQPPLAQESRVGDWEFEIRFTVELVRPDAARRAESAAPGARDQASPGDPNVAPNVDPTADPDADADADAVEPAEPVNRPEQAERTHNAEGEESRS